jgi:heat shock protein HslJ
LASMRTCATGAAFRLPGQAPGSAIVDGVTRRGQTVPMGYRAWRLAIVGVCTCMALLALAACRSATSAGPVPRGFTGYDWQVAAISHGGQVTTIPARMQVALRFSPGGQFGANDSVNFHSGTYRTTSDGFTTGDLDSTLVGYAGSDAAVLLAMSAMDSFNDSVHATVTLTGDRLLVRVGSYTLICQRGGPRTDDPAPAGTSG